MSSIVSYVKIVILVGTVWTMNRETNVTSNLCQERMLFIKLVTPFFYMHSIGEYNEQNTLNFEMALLHLKHNVSTEQLSVTDFLAWEEVICTRY
jgi:hypothetical protein